MNKKLEEKIIAKLKTVYDPEFPLVDMYTLGLIYDVKLIEENKVCDVTMTFTTPTCPMADMIMELVKNAVLDAIPEWEVNIIVSFDPMWSPSMIKDPDLLKMFL
ncbi:metal-sulfur cluster assembly factor [bacterium]|nr:metal-sulfur cluster assembly factor [bacterium]